MPRFETKAELFPRSVAALRGDGSSRPLAGIILTGALLAAWAVWLVGARLPLTVSSADGRVQPLAPDVDGRVSMEFVARFVDHDAHRLHPGQRAVLTLSAAGSSPQIRLGAFIDTVTTRGDRVALALTPDDGTAAIAQRGSRTAAIEVVVAEASPVELLLSAVQ